MYKKNLMLAISDFTCCASLSQTSDYGPDESTSASSKEISSPKALETILDTNFMLRLSPFGVALFSQLTS
jgi:hypothetical protein